MNIRHSIFLGIAFFVLITIGCHPPEPLENASCSVTIENRTGEPVYVSINFGSNSVYGGFHDVIPRNYPYATMEITGSEATFSGKENLMIRAISSLYLYDYDTYVAEGKQKKLLVYEGVFLDWSRKSNQTKYSNDTLFNPNILDADIVYGTSYLSANQALFVEPSAESDRVFYLERDIENPWRAKIIITKVPASPAAEGSE